MKINRDIEYAMIAVIHLKDYKDFVSAAQLSEVSKVPYKLLCKLLQKLHQAKLVVSNQGSKGGYCILQPFDQITLLEVVNAIHQDSSIISCGKNSLCRIKLDCMIQKSMRNLQGIWDNLLENITLKEFLEWDHRAPVELVKSK